MGSGRLIRRAVMADVPRIIDMIAALAASVDGPQRVCRVKAGETLCGLIHSPDGCVFVSDRGFIAGQIGQTVISPDPVAWELGWYAEDRTGIALLSAFEAWARAKGANLIKMSCKGGAAERILSRRGYRHAETAMVK